MSTALNFTQQDRLAVIELSRPDCLNAIDMTLRRELLAALEHVARDENTGALVLTGNGGFFCSGADLKSAAANPDTSVRRTARTLLHDFQPIIETIGRMDKPVIAAVNGPAVGVGMALALGCDLVVMASDAYLMAPFVKIGLIPDGGIAWFLTRRIGYVRAFESLSESGKLSAQRCLDLGLVNRVVEAQSVRAEALTWGRALLERAPLALALTKRIARLSMNANLVEIMTLEAELQTFMMGTEDAREALAAFNQKRSPVFRGR